MLKDGMEITCNIEGRHIPEAIVRLENGRYYICQNFNDGLRCKDTSGFSYSWVVESGSLYDLRANGVTNLAIIGKDSKTDNKNIQVLNLDLKYSEWINKSMDILKSYNIPTNYFNQLELERKTNKAELNNILGLNEDNNYRKILTSKVTDSEFSKSFPKTIYYIQKIVELTVPKYEHISFVKNKIFTNGEIFLKLSKVLSKNITCDIYYTEFRESCKELEIDPYKETYVSKLIDILKPKQTVISTNIYDMLTSSTNCAYHSCYCMDGGEYFNGNLSYIRDNFTVISFVFTSDIARKIGRSWVYVFPEQFKILTPTNPYGSMYTIQYKTIRTEIEHDICKHHDIPNYWKYTKNIGYTTGDFFNGRNAAVYFDYGRVGMAYHARRTDNTKIFLNFEEAMCLECGCDTTHPEKGICDDCDNSVYCTSCEDYTTGITFQIHNGDYICGYCYENYYSRCNDCGEIHINDDLTETDGYNYVCPNCLNNYTECSDCGTYSRNTNTVANGNDVCDNCFDNYTKCDECYEYIKNTDCECNDCGTYCNECFEKINVMEE